MLQLKDVVYENLNVFVGACVDPPNLCLLWHYCSKGSLNVSKPVNIIGLFTHILLLIAPIKSTVFIGKYIFVTLLVNQHG